MSTVKNPGPEDPALVSPHRGVINIALHMVGIFTGIANGL
jgi:hypothetical protein